jgi:hypothetical protein
LRQSTSPAMSIGSYVSIGLAYQNASFPPIANVRNFPDLSPMRSPALTAASLTGASLILSLAGEVIMRWALHVRFEWFFYAVLSAGLLGGVPFAPVLVRDRKATLRFRFAFAVCLLGLVGLNCWLVVLVNRSDLGWSKGDYTLAFPFLAYALGCLSGFYALRPKAASTR